MSLTTDTTTAEPLNRKRWYLLQSKPNQAARALEHLQRQAYPCFLPLRQVERVVRGRRQQTEEPLFPNYLFIQLDDVHDNWMPIRSTRGVSRLVGFGGQPLPVPDAVIEQLRQRMMPPDNLLQPGDRVRINNGSFAEIEAIFLAHDKDERVLLLINLLQRENTLSFHLKDISKV